MMMLEICDLSVAYGKHKALEDAGLKVSTGEIVVILGANGAGKSTLLKALSGICEGQVTGSIFLDGHDLSGLSADQIVEEGIALVPEGRGIFADLSVEENLKLGSFPKRAAGEEQANLDRVFALFPKLTERRRQIARTMSGGEQQMVAIARAMMSSPQILALDEPSLGLSPLLCKELFQNLKAVKELGIGVLMVEQNAKQSLAIADRGYLLENTRIVHEDSAEALRTDPAVQTAYLGGGGAPAAQKPVMTDDPPQMPTVQPPSPRTQSADALTGLNLNELVAKADLHAKKTAPPISSALKHSIPSKGSDIEAMLKEFEIAAARAGQARPLPEYKPAKTKPDPAPGEDPGPPTDTPVTIEIYRAPRVEVYRRRPDGGFKKE
jgi:branched-chain amino acid transport system ATP-binding protein